MKDKEEIFYNYYFWGPLLWRTKVLDKDLKELKKLCRKNKKKDFRKNLAGVIDNEYSIDKEKFSGIINKYLNAYLHAYKMYHAKLNVSELFVETAWVNYMKKGESNPIHFHLPCDLSSVLYIDVPKKLIQEQKNFIGRGGGPGAITFHNQNSPDHFVGSHSIAPETGDLFIFPAMLCHSVASFKSNVERVSIAANFCFKGGKFETKSNR